MNNLRVRVTPIGRNILYRARRALMSLGVTHLTTLYPGSIVHHGASAAPTPIAPDGLPFPPFPLALRVGGTGYEGFYQIGAEVKQRILQALPEDFRFEGSRVYEFGCGSGRVLRHFQAEAQGGEFWGSDIDYPSIEWLTEHLSPPFHVFQNTEYPVLPFESNSFDLVIVISVFTHLHENWSQWMMELRRILKPGGLIFCTFHGPNAYEESLRIPYHPGEYGMFVKNTRQSWNRFGPAVFHSPEWIATYWGSIFEIELLALGGLMDFQSIALMRKPLSEGKSPVRADVPIVQAGTTHVLNVNATGRIEHAYPAENCLPQAFGIRGRGQVPFRGWIAFKGDQAASMEVTVDGQPLVAFPASIFSPTPGLSPFGGNIPALSFDQTLDVSQLQPGTYMLKANFRSQKGDVYWLAIPLVIE